MKRIAFIFCSLILVSQLAACSSPEEKAADYIENANSLLDKGDITKAEIEYKNALQINQNLPDAWYGLARIHESKQEWRQVYATLNRIREINPKHVDGRIMLGQLLLASNQIDQALQDANEILELAPNDARAHSLMAAVQFRLENFDAARASVDRALTIDPANKEALLVSARVLIAEKKFDEAIALLDASIAKDSGNVSLYLMKIQAYGEQQDTGATQGVYRTLIERFPKQGAFRNALARSYLQTGDIDTAEKVLEEAVTADPDNIDEKIRLVSFKNQYRSNDDAIALLENYIQQDKTQYRFRFNLGDLYEKIGKSDAAADVYREIIEDDGLQPNGLEARNKLALIHLRAGELDKAKTQVDEVLSHDKNNESALLLQAGFKLNAGQYDDAIIDLRTVLRDNPDSIKALGLLGQAYEADGSRELAVEAYMKAFQQKPGTPPIANQLAKNLLMQNKAQQADEVMQQSVKSGNNSIDALKILTQVKLQLGDWGEAERYAQLLKKIEGQEALSEQVMGLVYFKREQKGESIEAFKRAHELAPESSQPLVSLVRTYVGNGQVDEAKQFLDSVIAENEKNLAAHLLLGQLGILENRVDTAIKHFRRIIEIAPNQELGYRSLASVYLRENRLEDAEKEMLSGMKAIPQNATLAIGLASIYERQQAFEKAIGIYEELLERNPESIVAKNNLASLLTDYRLDQESHDRARQMAAVFKDSSVPQFRDTYAWAAVKSGLNLEEAVVILEDVVKDNEQVGVYHFHLGEAYRKKGDLDNARTYLEKAVSLERPGSGIAEEAKRALQQLN